MIRAAACLAGLLALAVPVRAELDAPAPTYTDAQAIAAAVASGQLVTSFNGQANAVTTATIPSKFTVQPSGGNPLPEPTANPGRYDNAIDVGGVALGGSTVPAQVYSTGACWKQTSPYVVPLVVQAVTAIPVVALQQSPVMQLAGGSYSGAAAVRIVNACPGDVFTVMVSSGVFSLLGSPSLTLTINASRRPCRCPA